MDGGPPDMTPLPWRFTGQSFASYRFSGHSMQAWVTAALLFVVVFALLKIAVLLGRKALRAAARNGLTWPPLLGRAAGKTSPWFLATLAAVAASERLRLPAPTRALVGDIAATAFFVQVALWGHALIRAGTDRYRTRTEDSERITIVVALGLIGTILLWLLLALAALDNLGVNVTALLTGFGIGGVALALAAQNTLADFFAFLRILFDKPFVLGDTIAIDAYTGTIEHIGLKTTHLRSPSGEQIIIDPPQGNPRLESREELRVREAHHVVYYVTHGRCCHEP